MTTVSSVSCWLFCRCTSFDWIKLLFLNVINVDLRSFRRKRSSSATVLPGLENLAPLPCRYKKLQRINFLIAVLLFLLVMLLCLNKMSSSLYCYSCLWCFFVWIRCSHRCVVIPACSAPLSEWDVLIAVLLFLLVVLLCLVSNNCTCRLFHPRSTFSFCLEYLQPSQVLANLPTLTIYFCHW